MILALHIAVAMAGILSSLIAFISPSKRKIQLSFIFSALTFASGTFLIINEPAHMVQACIMGIFYLGITLSLGIGARNKLAIETALR